MKIVRRCGELTFELAINLEKQRAVIPSITGAGQHDAASLLDAALPELLEYVAHLKEHDGLPIGKLYLMVPEALRGTPEQHGLVCEARYPGILRNGESVAGLDYVYYFDPARRLPPGDRNAILRMVRQIERQPGASHHLSGYHIRRGLPEDAEKIAVLLASVFLFYDDFPAGITPSAVAGLFADSAYLCYICEHSHAVVGYLSAYCSPAKQILGYRTQELNLDTAAVARTERKKGIMTALVRQMKAVAEAEGRTWYSYCRVLIKDGEAMPTGMHRSMAEAGAQCLGILSYAYGLVTDEDVAGTAPQMVHAVAWGAAGAQPTDGDGQGG